MQIISNILTQDEYTTARSNIIELRAHHMGTRENLKTLASQGQTVPVELIDFHDRMLRAVSVFFPGLDDQEDTTLLKEATTEVEAEEEQENVPPPPTR